MSSGKRSKIQSLYRAFAGSPKDYCAEPFVFLNDTPDASVIGGILDDLSEKGFAKAVLLPGTGLSVSPASDKYRRALSKIVEHAKVLSMTVRIGVDYAQPIASPPPQPTFERPDLCARGLSFSTARHPDPRQRVLGTYLVRGRSIAHLAEHPARKKCLITSVDMLAPPGPHGLNDLSIPREGMGRLDILNPDAVNHYIDTVLEPLRTHLERHFGNTIEGILIRSPQNQCPFPWTDSLPDLFMKKFGYDLVACLPCLIRDVGDFISVRTNYYRLVGDLTRDFYRSVGKWASQYGLSFSATIGRERFIETLPHTHGDPYAVLSEMSVPATSYRCNGNRYLSDTPPSLLPSVTPKFVSSAARIARDDRALAAVWEGEGWGVTPQQLKRTIDCGVSLGITSFLIHGVFTSVVGLRKRDFPPSVYRQLPYWEDAGMLADYISRTCLMMSAGHSRADVLVLFPLTSITANTVGFGLLTGDGKKVVAGLNELVGRLLSDQRDFDFLYEEMLRRKLVRCGEGAVAIGPNRYSTLIIPWATHIPAPVSSFIEDAKKNGVTVIFVGRYPAVTDKRRSPTFTVGITLVKDTPDLIHYLRLNVPKQLYFLGEHSDKFLHQRRTLPGADIYFFSYLGEERFTGTLALAGSGTPEAWNPEDGRRYGIPEFQIIGGGVCFPVTFEPGRSWIYVIHSEETDTLHGLPALPGHRIGEFFFPGRWEVDYLSDNMFRIDNFRLIRSSPSVTPPPLRDLARDDRFGTFTKIVIASVRAFTESLGRIWGIRRKIGYRSFSSMEREMRLYASAARLVRLINPDQPHYRKVDLIRDASRYMGLSLSTPLPPEDSEFEIEANFIIGQIPRRISLVWEDTGEPIDIFINGILVSDQGRECFVWDRKNRTANLSDVIRWGTNRIGIRSRQPGFPTVIPAIHCVEPVVIAGDFDVSMDIITARKETTRHLSWGKIATGNYSGTIAYRNRFRVPRRFAGKVSILDLGDVRVACRVVLNGKDLGAQLWPPYRYDLTGALSSGDNEIEISVTNTAENLLGSPIQSGITTDPKIMFFDPL
jgi:hypothetical protein